MCSTLYSTQRKKKEKKKRLHRAGVSQAQGKRMEKIEMQTTLQFGITAVF